MSAKREYHPKFVAGHAHFYMLRPLIAKAILLGCLFEVEGGEMVVNGGEMVVNGGEMVVTGGEMVVTGRELDGGDWRRDVQWWPPRDGGGWWFF